MLDFVEHPGLWFVAATLLPLMSVVLLLLAGFLRNALRARRTPADSRPVCSSCSAAR